MARQNLMDLCYSVPQNAMIGRATNFPYSDGNYNVNFKVMKIEGILGGTEDCNTQESDILLDAEIHT